MSYKFKKGNSVASKYKPEHIDRIDDYLRKNKDRNVKVLKQENKEKGHKIYENQFKVRLPTLTGFAIFLGVTKRTLENWEKKYPEFKKATNRIRDAQRERLINRGLSDDYNSTIAKLLLSANHGMKERTEQTVKEESKFSDEQINRIAERITRQKRANGDTSS